MRERSTLQINLIAFSTIVRKEVMRFTRIWPQTLLPSVITMTLYFMIFGKFIGSRVGEMGGFPYVEYIAPGLVMMAIITNAYANVSASFYGSKFGRSIEELLIAPVYPSVILLGYTIGGVLRAVMVGVLVILVSLFFTHLQIKHLFLVFVVILLSAILFSLAGFLNGLFAKKFDDISIIPTFVLTPLTYLGGVFYSIDLLSPGWYKVSLLNPVLYMVNAFRYGILGASDIPIGFALFITLLFTIGLFLLNLNLLKRGVGIRS